MNRLLHFKGKTVPCYVKKQLLGCLLILFTISNAFGTNYYYDGAGNISTVGNWWTNTNGTGSNPANFTAAGNVFNIRNAATATLIANWAVSGTGSKVTVGDGTTACNFTIPATLSYTGTIDVLNAATLTITHNTVVPTIGTLGATSTVVFNSATAQSVPALAYANLTIGGTSTKTAAGDISVSSTLSVTGTLAMGTNEITTVGTPSGTGIITTASVATAPIPANENWATIEIDYIGASQNVVAGTYGGDLVINGTGTMAATGTIAMGAAKLTVNNTLNMGTQLLTGATAMTTAGTSLLQTANTTTAPIPTGHTWTFEVEYNGAAQSVLAGTYSGDLTISGTGIKAALGTVAMGTAKLIITSTLNMGTQLLTGAMTTGGTTAGLLQTGNTSAAPIPTTRTWNFNVEYNGSAVAIMTGTYNFDLNLNGTATKILQGTSTVVGDCNFNSGIFAINNSTTARTLTVNGDFNEAGTYVDMNTATSGLGTLILKGNLTQTAGFFVTTSATNGIIDFAGAGTLVAPQIISINPATTNTTNAIIVPGTGIPYVNIAVESGTVVQLNSSVQLNNNATAPGTFTVKTGGTLNMQGNIINGNTAAATRSDFILQTGATLITTNAAGINSAGTTGAIQTTATTTSRSFNSGATYEFDGTGATGVFTTSTPLTVANLVVNSTGTVTASQNFAVTTALKLTSGTLNMGTNLLTAVASNLGTGTLETQATATAVPTGVTWTVPVLYDAAGAQAVVLDTYKNLSFAGTGVKTFPVGTTSVTGDWSSTSGKIDLTTNAVVLNFTGATAQAIADAGSDGGNGVFFKTVNFSGGGTKTMSGTGKFSLASNGTLGMSGSTILAAGGVLWLKSDGTGSAIVSAIPSGSSITGDVFAERFIYGNNSNTRRGYRLLSSPTHDGVTSTYNIFNLKQNLYITGTGDALPYDANDASKFDNSPNHGSTIFHYYEPIAGNQNNADYKPITLPLTNDEFNVGEGMYVFYRGLRTLTDLSAISRFSTTVKPEDNTLVFKGTLNQGNYSPTLSYTNAGFMVDGQNLVGNPYASSIDIRGAGVTYNNIADFVYQLDPTTKAFSILVRSTGVGTGNSSRYIASGQGFFVQATGAGASITFTESAKVTNQLTLGTTLLMSTSPVAAAQVPQVLKLKMINPADSTAADDIAIVFDAAGKEAYDKAEDGFDLGGNGTTALSSLSADNVKLAINTYPAITKTTKIKLTAVSLITGNFNMVAGNLSTLDSKYEAFLVDNYKTDTIKLSTTSAYAFTIDRTIPATYADGRFEIVFKDAPVAVNALLNFSGTQVNKTIELNWTVAANPLPVKFTLEKSTDKVYYTALTTILSDSRDTYSYTDTQPQDGDNYYRLGQTDVSNHLKYSDTIDVKYDKNAISVKPFRIYPQPVVSTLNIALNEPYNGAVHYKITDVFGLVVKKGNFTGSTYSLDLSKLYIGIYVIELSKGNDDIGQAKFIKL
jgi:hypothetical protein